MEGNFLSPINGWKILNHPMNIITGSRAVSYKGEPLSVEKKILGTSSETFFLAFRVVHSVMYPLEVDDNLSNRLIWLQGKSTLERFHPKGDASLLTEVKKEYEIR